MDEIRDLNWIYAAKDNQELKERYDRWAGEYDRTLGDLGWSGPQETVEYFARHVPATARVLDVGAGTGQVGACLKARGFTDFDALDLSPGMMEIARQRGIYANLHRMTLGERLDFESDVFGGVVASGVFTLGHAPAGSLDELARITKPGGAIAFLTRDNVFLDLGFKEKMDQLSRTGAVDSVETSPPLVVLPNEPDPLVHHVHVFRVLR